ncbi:hypothetical protein LRR81_01555 [Metabacillus sp. GX 13764]|uniref:hypothetical protein n=1 Tax=Metabacillus kandeliae TaxID=2900151 RepID=UPI001E3A2FB8|nr:hypothetical protein [Metabacillus kandeliae]MCD7032897.1 hypothetical protein [Metabacillus kandeliae]
MRKKFNRYTMPAWMKEFRSVGIQFVIPLAVFQGIRTILFPTSFDVILLAALIILALAIHLEWI